MNEGKSGDIHTGFDQAGWDLLRYQLRSMAFAHKVNNEIWPTLKAQAMRMLKIHDSDLEEWVQEKLRQQDFEGYVDEAGFFLQVMDQWDNYTLRGTVNMVDGDYKGSGVWLNDEAWRVRIMKGDEEFHLTHPDGTLWNRAQIEQYIKDMIERGKQKDADEGKITIEVLMWAGELNRLRSVFEKKCEAEDATVLGGGRDPEALIRYFAHAGADMILQELKDKELMKALEDTDKKGAGFWGHCPNYSIENTECTDWEFDTEYTRDPDPVDHEAVAAYKQRVNAGLRKCSDCLWNDPPCVHEKGESKGVTEK